MKNRMVLKMDELGLEIAQIAFPAALALTADPIASLVDTAFIGQIGKLFASTISALHFPIIMNLYIEFSSNFFLDYYIYTFYTKNKLVHWYNWEKHNNVSEAIV